MSVATTSVPAEFASVVAEYRRAVAEAARNGHTNPHYAARDLRVAAYKVLLAHGYDIEEAVTIVMARLD